jgi:NAD(P)-dependent dehydrogenase (short-subunit alcohol dehydrogenase family)
MLLQGRAAIVTGSGSGIGKAIAELFLQHGALVVVNDISKAVVEKAIAAMPHPDRCAAVAGDISAPETIEALVSTCLERFGRLDIVVNNAGIAVPGLATTQPVDEMRRTFEVNLLAQLFLAQAALPALKQSPAPRIINVASEVGLTGMMFQSTYASSKRAVNGMTKSMSRALGKYGITVNSICPGIVLETPLVSDFLKERPEYEGALKFYKENSPLMRPLRATDIADVAVMLASDQAGFLTGQLIVANGGMG